MLSTPIIAKDGNLSIPRYVKPVGAEERANGKWELKKAWAAFDAGGRDFWQQIESIIEMLDGVAVDEGADA
jgi:type I restriction enzyme M protein